MMNDLSKVFTCENYRAEMCILSLLLTVCLFDHPEVEEVWLIGCKHPIASPALPH